MMVAMFLLAADLTFLTGERVVAPCEARAYVRPPVAAAPSIPPMPAAGPPIRSWRLPGDLRLPGGGTNTTHYIQYQQRMERAREFNQRRNQ